MFQFLLFIICVTLRTAMAFTISMFGSGFMSLIKCRLVSFVARTNICECDVMFNFHLLLYLTSQSLLQRNGDIALSNLWLSSI